MRTSYFRNFFINRLNYKNGFSLLEVMIVAGLMSVVGLAITSIVSNSSKMQKHLEQKDTALNISGSIRALLQNQDLCKSAFCSSGETCNSLASGLLTGPFPTRTNPTVAPILLSGVQLWNGANTVSPISIVKCLASENCNQAEPKIGSPVSSSPGLFVVSMAIKEVRFAAQQGANTDLVSGKLSIVLQHDRKVSHGVQQFRPLEFDINLVVNKTDGQMLGCSGGGISEIWKRSASNSANIYYTDGNVGVGNSNPLNRLHVKGNGPATTQPVVRIENAANSSYMLFEKGDASANSEFVVGGDFVSGAFRIASGADFNSATNLLIADSSGVSVGGSNALSKTLSATTGTLNLASPNGNVRLLTGANVRMTVDTTGAASIPVSLTVGSDAGTDVAFVSEELSRFDNKLTVSSGGIDITGASKLNNKLTVTADGASITGPIDLLGSVSVGSSTAARDITMYGNSFIREIRAIAGQPAITIANDLKVNGNIIGDPTYEIRDFRVISTSSGTPSDIRLKKNVIPLSGQSDIINQIMTYSYNYIEDVENTLHFGFVAQELKRLFPSLVRKDSKGFYYINSTELIPIAIKGLQESNARIQVLEEKVESLEKRILRLESLLENQSSN